MLDTVSKTVSLVVATIGAGTTIYKILFKNEYSRKQAYYKSLLKPFIVAYKKNPDMSVVEFVKSNAKYDNDNIPKYIFYLVDAKAALSEEMTTQQNSQAQPENNVNCATQNSEEKLRKVLIDDYLALYSNEYSKKRNVFEIVHKSLNYLLFLLSFLFIFYGTLRITNGIVSLVSFLFADTFSPVGNWLLCIGEALFGIAVSFTGLFPIKISEWRGKDMYSIKKKPIQKLIHEKVRRYDRHFDNYVL